MTNSDAGKKPTSDKTPASQKPGAELQENELEQISGGSALAKPTNPHRKKPNVIPPFV